MSWPIIYHMPVIYDRDGGRKLGFHLPNQKKEEPPTNQHTHDHNGAISLAEHEEALVKAVSHSLPVGVRTDGSEAKVMVVVDIAPHEIAQMIEWVTDQGDEEQEPVQNIMAILNKIHDLVDKAYTAEGMEPKWVKTD